MLLAMRWLLRVMPLPVLLQGQSHSTQLQVLAKRIKLIAVVEVSFFHVPKKLSLTLFMQVLLYRHIQMLLATAFNAPTAVDQCLIQALA